MSSIKRNRYIDGKLLLAYPDDYTVLDIETTGLSPQNDYITEISAIKYRNNRRVDEFSSLVKPELSIPYYNGSPVSMTLWLRMLRQSTR